MDKLDTIWKVVKLRVSKHNSQLGALCVGDVRIVTGHGPKYRHGNPLYQCHCRYRCYLGGYRETANTTDQYIEGNDLCTGCTKAT